MQKSQNSVVSNLNDFIFVFVFVFTTLQNDKTGCSFNVHITKNSFLNINNAIFNVQI